MQQEAICKRDSVQTAKEKRKMTFCKMVYIYMLGGLVGTLWETCFNLVRGRGFVHCSGSILTPFNFVYGLGAVVIIFCLRNHDKWWQVYLCGALGGGAVEYLLSFLEEKILGTRSWNYEGRLWNINGRTTVPYMAFWGLLCVAVIFIVYRPLDAWLDSLPAGRMQATAIVMATIIALDFVVTVSALLRYTGRFASREAVTALGRVLDKVFNDAFMGRRFPKMRF